LFAARAPPPNAETHQQPTIAEISYQRATSAGFLPVMNWVCAVKHVPCEMLLVLAQLETGTGALGDTDRSSAATIWQITDTQFVRRARIYGPDDLPSVAAYLRALNPSSAEAVRTRKAYDILVTWLPKMETDKYEEDRHFAQIVDGEILKARDGNLVIPALLVVDCLINDLNYLARKTGMTPEEAFRYTDLVHVYGVHAAGVVLSAYRDPYRVHQQAAPILINHYAHLYASDEPGATPAIRSKNADRDARAYVQKILTDNGEKMSVTVRALVDGRVEKYVGLASGIRRQLDHNLWGTLFAAPKLHMASVGR
jgi:hypothetical protein